MIRLNCGGISIPVKNDRNVLSRKPQELLRAIRMTCMKPYFLSLSMAYISLQTIICLSNSKLKKIKIVSNFVKSLLADITQLVS